jgi:hypothetical protein
VRRLGALALVVAAVAVAAAVALAAQSPKALRNAIAAAARSQHSVHWQGTDVVGGARALTGADVSTSEGSQHVTFYLGQTKAHVQILVVDHTAYVNGDALGLRLNLGLTSAQATKYAGQWISIPKTAKLYAGTAEADTLGSLVTSIVPRGHVTAFSAKLHGSRIVGVRSVHGKGKKKTLQILDARAHGKRLPVEEDEVTPGMNAISRTVLSRWNEAVQVQAPANAVPISTVLGQT